MNDVVPASKTDSMNPGEGRRPTVVQAPRAFSFRTSVTGMPSGVWHSQRQWCIEQLAPVADRYRRQGLVRAAPASLLIILSSSAVTALALGTGDQHHVVNHALAYRGLDFYEGTWWKLITSGLLAQSWLQFLWTALVTAMLFAPLEVRVGPFRMLLAILSAQVIATVAVAIGAPLAGHADELARPDFGTSCLVVGAAAALAWVRRSRLFGAVIVTSLLVDAMLSAPATAIEHSIGVLVGALAMMLATPDPRRRPHPIPAAATDGAAATALSRA